MCDAPQPICICTPTSASLVAFCTRVWPFHHLGYPRHVARGSRDPHSAQRKLVHMHTSIAQLDNPQSHKHRAILSPCIAFIELWFFCRRRKSRSLSTISAFTPLSLTPRLANSTRTSALKGSSGSNSPSSASHCWSQLIRTGCHRRCKSTAASRCKCDGSFRKSSSARAKSSPPLNTSLKPIAFLVGVGMSRCLLLWLLLRR